MSIHQQYLAASPALLLALATCNTYTVSTVLLEPCVPMGWDEDPIGYACASDEAYDWAMRRASGLIEEYLAEHPVHGCVPPKVHTCMTLSDWEGDIPF